MVRELVGGMPSVEEIEEELGRREFPRFLRYVKIAEPPTPMEPAGTPEVSFQVWGHLREMAELLGREKLIVIIKARQLGFTWELAAYATWFASYHAGAVVFLQSQGEYEAAKMLYRAKTVHSLLPKKLQVPFSKAPSTRELAFVNGSIINAFPSTPEAGRSGTASLVIQDEADWHEFLEQNFAAMKPTIDAGGQYILVTTVNKLKMRSLVREIYRGSPLNGWAKYFAGWRARPGRDDAWYERTKVAVPTTSRLSPELYMSQEYPETEEDALAPAEVLSAFDQAALRDMQRYTMEPLQGVVDVPQHASCYQLFAPGRRYVAFTDTSHGVGLDFGVTVILDVNSGYVVADVMANNLSPQDLAYESANLLKLYHQPLWGIEDNDWGILAIETAIALGYRQLFRDPNREDKYGLHTDQGRYLLWGELVQAVKSRQITVPSKAGLAQFMGVINNPNKNGRIEAMEGAHDDYPLAVAGAWWLRRYVHGGKGDGVAVPQRW